MRNCKKENFKNFEKKNLKNCKKNFKNFKKKNFKICKKENSRRRLSRAVRRGRQYHSHSYQRAKSRVRSRMLLAVLFAALRGAAGRRTRCMPRREML